MNICNVFSVSDLQMLPIPWINVSALLRLNRTILLLDELVLLKAFNIRNIYIWEYNTNICNVFLFYELQMFPVHWINVFALLQWNRTILLLDKLVTTTISKSTPFHTTWQRAIRFWLDLCTWPNITLSPLRRAIRILDLPLNTYKRNI